MDRARPDMAEAARHADAIGTHQLLVVVVARIAEIALRIPSRCSCRIEGRVRKQPQSEYATRIAVQGAHGYCLAACPNRDARILALVLKGISRAVRPPNVQQQTKALRIRPLWRIETRLIQYAEPGPTPSPIRRLRRVIGDDFQQVEGAEARYGQPVPKAIVAASPHQPYHGNSLPLPSAGTPHYDPQAWPHRAHGLAPGPCR